MKLAAIAVAFCPATEAALQIRHAGAGAVSGSNFHAGASATTIHRKKAPGDDMSIADLMPEQMKDFGWFRALGTKAGYGRGSEQESTFEEDTGASNHFGWGQQGQGFQFRMLDDLEPAAPMDQIGSSIKPSYLRGTPDNGPGVQGNAIYIPAYLFPDAFPVIKGATCTCQLPNRTAGENNTLCSCPTEGGEAFRWVRTEPVFNTSNFTVAPADLTYPTGDYWHPDVRHTGNIVAPEDRLPITAYPLQSKADKIRSLPAFAREDRIPKSYAKYLDQVEQRQTECDPISPECTNPCLEGDVVTLYVGNSLVPNATVKSAHQGNALTVEFPPPCIATGACKAGGPACPVSAGCSAFRPCFDAAFGTCDEMHDVSFHDWANNLQHKDSCREGTTICGTIESLLSAVMAQKDGKTCKAAIAPTLLQEATVRLPERRLRRPE